jgi:hypothetical protein
MELRCVCVGLGLISSRLGPDLSGNGPASSWAHVGVCFARFLVYNKLIFLCNLDVSPCKW